MEQFLDQDVSYIDDIDDYEFEVWIFKAVRRHFL